MVLKEWIYLLLLYFSFYTVVLPPYWSTWSNTSFTIALMLIWCFEVFLLKKSNFFLPLKVWRCCKQIWGRDEDGAQRAALLCARQRAHLPCTDTGGISFFWWCNALNLTTDFFFLLRPQSQQGSRAISVCSEVLTSDPENVNALKDRAAAYILEEQYEDGKPGVWSLNLFRFI